MESKFRVVAENVAEAIRNIPQFAGRADVSVVVEDKGDVDFQIAEAVAGVGVCVIVGVMGFSRRSQSGPVVSGTLNLEIRVIERPSVNRNEQGAVTAQEASEVILRSAHWRRVPGLAGPLLFDGFTRDDTAEMDVVRNTYNAEMSFGLAEASQTAIP